MESRSYTGTRKVRTQTHFGFGVCPSRPPIGCSCASFNCFGRHYGIIGTIVVLQVPELLRASHIKPWADCETDAERLDVHNGLLLAPQFDAAFDLGFITINDVGEVVLAQVLPDEAPVLLGFDGALRDEHRGYLAWHREQVFRKDAR